MKEFIAVRDKGSRESPEKIAENFLKSPPQLRDLDNSSYIGFRYMM
jgi:hypothetical protein